MTLTFRIRARLLAQRASRFIARNARSFAAAASLAATGTGLWWERPSLALIVPGATVFACLVWSHTRGPHA